MLDKEARKKGLEARKANIIAAQQLKQDWLDSELWDELARTRGIRLPQWSRFPTSRKLKQWHQTLESGPFREVYACSPARLIILNPKVPLRAFVGQMLERASG